MYRAVLSLAVLLLPALASAQLVVNPTRVEFLPSPDDAQVSRYEIGYYQVGAAEPVQVSTLGRPACSPACTVALQARPLPILTRYIARVRAYAADEAFVSPWSEPSNEFGYTPAAGGKPTITK